MSEQQAALDRMRQLLEIEQQCLSCHDGIYRMAALQYARKVWSPSRDGWYFSMHWPRSSDRDIVDEGRAQAQRMRLEAREMLARAAAAEAICAAFERYINLGEMEEE